MAMEIKGRMVLTDVMIGAWKPDLSAFGLVLRLQDGAHYVLEVSTAMATKLREALAVASEKEAELTQHRSVLERATIHHAEHALVSQADGPYVDLTIVEPDGTARAIRLASPHAVEVADQLRAAATRPRSDSGVH